MLHIIRSNYKMGVLRRRTFERRTPLYKLYYTGVSEMAQKVFEGDVVFSILNGRFFSINQTREHNISFEDFLGHRRDPRVQGEIVKLQEFAPIIICVILRKNDNSGLKLKVL